MSYTSDSDEYEEALSERQAAWKDTLVAEALVSGEIRKKAVRLVGRGGLGQPVLKPGPASRPAPHDAQSEAAVLRRRTLAGPHAVNDCAPPAAATAQEQRQPAPTAPREQNGERDAR